MELLFFFSVCVFHQKGIERDDHIKWQRNDLSRCAKSEGTQIHTIEEIQEKKVGLHVNSTRGPDINTSVQERKNK